MLVKAGAFILRGAIYFGACYVLYETVKFLDAFHDDDDQTCRTVKKTRTYSNKWIIESFDTKSPRIKLNSAVYSGTTNDGDLVKWTYLLFEDYGHIGDIRINVECETENTREHYVQIELEYGKSGKLQYSGPIGRASFKISHHDWKNSCSWTGSLTLRFEVTLIVYALKESLPEAPPSSLAENYDALLQNEQFTDVTITVGQQCFRAHKLILVARSTVFAAMFQHDMQEAQHNEVTITDLEPPVFQEVLRFIYSDRVEGLRQMAHELLAAAEKYDLARLKALCEIELISGLRAASATKTLAFADMYNAEALRARTLQFIIGNLREIPSWPQFCNANPDLAAEIFEEIAKGKNRTSHTVANTFNAIMDVV